MPFGIPNEAQIQAMIDGAVAKAVDGLKADGASWIDTVRALAETHTAQVRFVPGGVDVNCVLKGKS